MERTNETNRVLGPVVAFSTAAAVAAAVVGIGAYLIMVRKAVNDPREILSKCRSAIEQIENDFHLAMR